MASGLRSIQRVSTRGELKPNDSQIPLFLIHQQIYLFLSARMRQGSDAVAAKQGGWGSLSLGLSPLELGLGTN